MTMEEFRMEAEKDYMSFEKGKLVAKSREFGTNIRRHAHQVTEHYHFIEVREVASRYLAGCVQRVRIKADGEEVESKFKWFDLYKHEPICSIAACDDFIERFIAGFNGAAEDHHQAGLAHLLEEMQRAF